MAKTAVVNKCQEANGFSENRINELPDEIIVSVLSLLSMREAASTAVLCRRWRYLWTYTARLDFDYFDKVCKVKKSMKEALGVGKHMFVDWVNKVLKAHQGLSLDEFRVSFCVQDETFRCDIDSWIAYALVRRVKRLELRFYDVQGNYTLTYLFLSNYILVSLVELHLCYVDVNGEVLEHFLSNCPFLEVLCVQFSNSLVNLRVSGTSLMLKYLSVRSCFNLKNMEISAPNLTSFEYGGKCVIMNLKDVPHLVEASFHSYFAWVVIRTVCQFSSYLSQLETLKLDIGYKLKCQMIPNPPKYPELRNLKQLDITLNADVRSLSDCTSLLMMAPSLHRLTLELQWESVNYDRKMKMLKAKRAHQCLKVFELVGFRGCAHDLEFVRYVLTTAVSLEKMVIDPVNEHFDICFCDPELSWLTDEKFYVTERARKLLEPILPGGVELVIL